MCNHRIDIRGSIPRFCRGVRGDEKSHNRNCFKSNCFCLISFFVLISRYRRFFKKCEMGPILHILEVGRAARWWIKDADFCCGFQRDIELLIWICIRHISIVWMRCSRFEIVMIMKWGFMLDVEKNVKMNNICECWFFFLVCVHQSIVIIFCIFLFSVLNIVLDSISKNVVQFSNHSAPIFWILFLFLIKMMKNALVNWNLFLNFVCGVTGCRPPPQAGLRQRRQPPAASRKIQSDFPSGKLD